MNSAHSFRSQEGHEKYEEYKRQLPPNPPCPYCERTDVVHTFRLWKILVALYPYDLIASTHDLLMPIRHITEDRLTDEEREELIEIKHTYLKEHYQYILEPTVTRKTIPDHFHLHLINGK